MHICQCMDPGCNRMLQILMMELCTCITNTLGEMTVASTAKAFLLSWRESTMASCLHGNNANLALVPESSDCLGWDSLVEGWISTHWLPLITLFLRCCSQYLLPLAWGQQLMTKLMPTYIRKVKRDGQCPRSRTSLTGLSCIQSPF